MLRQVDAHLNVKSSTVLAAPDGPPRVGPLASSSRRPRNILAKENWDLTWDIPSAAENSFEETVKKSRSACDPLRKSRKEKYSSRGGRRTRRHDVYSSDVDLKAALGILPMVAGRARSPLQFPHFRI